MHPVGAPQYMYHIVSHPANETPEHTQKISCSQQNYLAAHEATNISTQKLEIESGQGGWINHTLNCIPIFLAI
jgi:hypothetical protein